MNSPPIRVAIVDDQRLFRGGLKMILAGHDDFHVVFEAEHGRQFLKRLSFEPVNVVILDVEMPEMDGVETLRYLQEHHPEIKVLMLTMHDSERLITHLMQLGASGFLLKDEEPEVVCKAVREVHQNGLFFRDYVSKALLKNGRMKAARSTNHFSPKLSERETQILSLLCQEKTSKEIGDLLFISARTVEGHRRSLQEKTGSRNLAGLVMYAVRNGIV